MKSKHDEVVKAVLKDKGVVEGQLKESASRCARLEAELATAQKDLQRQVHAKEVAVQKAEEAVQREAELAAKCAKLQEGENSAALLTQQRDEAAEEAAELRNQANSLKDHNKRMQILIKTMACQMENLQTNLKAQTALVARLQGAVEAGRTEETSLRTKIEETERRLTQSRIKATKQQKEATRQAGIAPVSSLSPFSTKSEVDSLFRRLKTVCTMYRLNMGPLLSGKLREDGFGSATDLQLLQVIHGMLAALETFGPSVSSAGGIATMTG
eukprot:gene6168-2782_t